MSNKDQYTIAEQHYYDEEYKKAFLIYKKLAAEGSVPSQVFLGWMYQKGLGVEKDFEKSFFYYKHAAKLGSSEAQFYLAKLYAKQGDFEETKIWYLKAAENKYSPALFRLGWIYDIGRGVTSDKERALQYYERASNLGHIFAKKYLAILLMKGHKGFLFRMLGILIFVQCIGLTISVAAKDPYSERLKD